MRLGFPDEARLVVRIVAAIRGRYSFLRGGPVEAWVSGEGRSFALAVPDYSTSPYVIPLRVPRGSHRRAGR